MAADLIEYHLTVTHRHRVAFTRDVFHPANATLRNMLVEPDAPPRRLLLVADQAVLQAQPTLNPRIEAYCATLRPNITTPTPPLALPAGEAIKGSWGPIEQILSAIHHAGLDRHSYLLALGGGALLDAAGFAASIAHRGVRHIRLPTTTLAQADSGVGVKNGINLLGQKNFAGTFTPPWAVINDLDLLQTLPDREKRCGAAEAVKVACIRDRAFFETLEANASRLAAFEPEALESLVRRCATLHLHHIASSGDPFETGSARPLDFGHWSAHKLEQLSDFRLRHGEAVAIGIALDTLYSRDAGYLAAGEAARVLHLLRQLGFRLDAPELLDPRLPEGLQEFQAHLGGALTLTLLRALGDGFETHTYDTRLLPACIAELLRTAP